jgi:hypothetical protein
VEDIDITWNLLFIVWILFGACSAILYWLIYINYKMLKKDYKGYVFVILISILLFVLGFVGFLIILKKLEDEYHR